MGALQALFLVDDDTRRRATICRLLAEAQVYVEPFESRRELCAFRPSKGVVMVLDAPGELVALRRNLALLGRWLPMIAFSESARPAQVARAVLNGATSYV